MTDLFPRLDSYERKARLHPASLTVLPLVVVAYATLHLRSIWWLAPMLGGAGVLYLVMGLVRSLGLSAQDRLVPQWGGLPTTVLLRHATGGNQPLRARRHEQLSRLLGRKLPEPAEEAADPAAADEIYVLAVGVLKARVNENHSAFPRVHEELTLYGFRRNTYGLRAVGLTVAGVTVIWSATAWAAGASAVGALVGVAAAGVAAIFWEFVVTPHWVREAGERYAERLFEALESAELRESRSDQ